MSATFMEHGFETLALRRLLKPAWSLRYEASDDVLPGVIAPDAQVELVFQLGSPCMIVTDGRETASHRAMIYALRHGALELKPTGPNAIVAFRLPTVVATVVLGACLSECWDRPIALAELMGADADDLLGALAETPVEVAGPVIESWLLSRLAGWDPDHARQLRLQDELFWEFDDQPVSTLAEALGFTERTLRRHCETHAGLSPKQIVMSGRMLRGCDLLRRSAIPVTDVAGRLGFNDQAAFANAFRRYLGMTPAQLRSLPTVHYERRR